MSEHPPEVDGLDDEAVAAVSPETENQTTFFVKPDDETVTVNDDQTPAPLT
ncbi:MAG: hypothetical protein L0H96_10540 [Humibacillus sp.]|nr:hypothetical protein [Humibacillus sp.]MDN5777338.1 hypothetical protein [Humibacillus sp.]